MIRSRYYLSQRQIPYTMKRLVCVVVAAALMAFNINTFVHAGGLIPGGFTGLALLMMESFQLFGGLNLPFSVILFTLNAIPAFLSYRYIGHRFTLYSCLMIVLSGLLTDWTQPTLTNFLQVRDMLLVSVFGGLLNALSISLCLFANATSGGTDFIAIFFSEKYGRDSWHYIFVGNCVILVLAGGLFSLDKALYSIIFQFTTTMALKSLFRNYQRMTLFIITDKPDEAYALIRDKTRHDATSFTGIGRYKMVERVILYSVVSASEVTALVSALKELDPGAFINILKTERLDGKFYKPSKD